MRTNIRPQCGSFTVEVILIHPALLVLQMRAIVVLVPNRHQDACWLPCLQDRHHLVGFGILEILLHELVSPALVVIALGSIQKRNAPFFGSVLDPVLELIGDFRQAPPGDPFPLSIGVEKAKYALGLLEWLYQSIQQHAIKAAVPELNAILVMLDEGVHSPLLCGEIPGAYRRERLRGQRSLCGPDGYQGRSPWLVSLHFGNIRIYCPRRPYFESKQKLCCSGGAEALSISQSRHGIDLGRTPR